MKITEIRVKTDYYESSSGFSTNCVIALNHIMKDNYKFIVLFYYGCDRCTDWIGV